MEKVIRDGRVAVLYSPGYGAGWYTWHGRKELVFHPKIVELVEAGKPQEITDDLCRELLNLTPETYLCTLGAKDLEIRWLLEGTVFRIEEYDGNECIEVIADMETLCA